MNDRQERHNLESIEAREIHGTCPHGNAPGVSNYDVWFCGECEYEVSLMDDPEYGNYG